MKARIFCKMKFGGNYHMDDSNICTDKLKETIDFFGYQDKINAQYSFGVKDYQYALRFFPDLIRMDNWSRLENSGYKPLNDWINERKVYFKTIIDAINKKYPDNDFQLFYYMHNDVEFALEDSDIFHEGDNPREFCEVEFSVKLDPIYKGCEWNTDIGTVLENIQRLYSQYGFRSVFKFKEKFRYGVCDVFDKILPEQSFKIYNEFNTSEQHKKFLEKIDKDFDDTIKNLIKNFNIDETKICFEKYKNVQVKWTLTDEDVY